MSESSQPNEAKRFDKKYYHTLIHQYLASLTSSDPFSAHVLPLSKVIPSSSSSSTPEEETTIEIPPLPSFLHDQAQQIEYPNLLNPKGGSSDRDTILLRAQAAKSVIVESNFEVQSILITELASDGLVSPEHGAADDGAVDIKETGMVAAAVEALWTGTVAKDLSEKLMKGLVMKARFAMFFELKDGKIFRQRNYDCFDAF